MPLTDFPQFLHDVTRRYRASLMARTGLTAALSLGVCGALAWRLHRLHRSMIWSAGLPVTLALLAIGLLVWRLRRRWLFAATAVAQLDRALGLQQRFITAEEFARAQEKPALYPLLLEDLARRASEARVRFPRPLDRSAGTLLVALMVLLLWPHLHEASRGVLTQRPSMASSQRPRHEEPPPVPGPEEERQSGGSPREGDSSGTDQSAAAGAGASQDGSSGASGDPATRPARAGSGESRAGEQSETGSRDDGRGHAGRSKDRSAQTDSQGQGGTAAQDEGSAQRDLNQATGRQPKAADHGSDLQESPAFAGSPGRQPGEEGEAGVAAKPGRQGTGEAEHASQSTDARAQDAEEEGAQSESHAQPSPSSQADAGGQQKTSQRAAQSSHQKGAGTQQVARATSAPDASSSVRAGQPSDQTSQGRAAAPRAGGQGQSGGEDALKAEIQQLLKEVSGELQRLETQLAATSNDANPTAGTSTDPNLYESAMPLDGTPQGSLPIQLRTDQAPTRAQRPGSGVGAPSGEVARASPQTAPTEAQLAEAPLEEPPVARQTVPREYQSVFDRLHQR
ncbi:MAG: hypothetical protein Q8R91_05175 [Candidatus Omnitrophota bacterium]|nr:hypothetical protein [Candidatus Omnitrophota bacterium]